MLRESALQVFSEADIDLFGLRTFQQIQVEHKISLGSEWAGLLHIVCNWFQVYFTPLTGVLFTFPSRYLFTIGCQLVFSLIPWSGRIHAEFHVHRITWDTSSRFQTLLTRLSRSLVNLSRLLSSSFTWHIKVPQPRGYKYPRFRLFRFRSPLLTESLSFSFPGVTEMFHFTPFRFAGL